MRILPDGTRENDFPLPDARPKSALALAHGWARLLHGNICGIIDSHGAVDSRLSLCGEGLLQHEDIWPMKLAGKWRWNHDRSIHCFCDRLNAEEFAAVQSHLTKKYGLQWWENGHHDIDHLQARVAAEKAASPNDRDDQRAGTEK